MYVAFRWYWYDCNSRTGTLSDFEELTNAIFNNLNIEEDIRSKLINETNLNNLGITTDRLTIMVIVLLKCVYILIFIFVMVD